MAASTSCRCSVCLDEVPDSRSRRRLHSDSTIHVLPILRSLGDATGYNDRDGVICRPCLRDAEKILRLRRELEQLECKMKANLKRPTEQSESGGHGSTASTTPTGSPSQPHHGGRKRLQSERQKSQSPLQPSPKRRLIATPTRTFMQQTHVAKSPAVAVSCYCCCTLVF